LESSGTSSLSPAGGTRWDLNINLTVFDDAEKLLHQEIVVITLPA